jgi:DNA modification methylase
VDATAQEVIEGRADWCVECGDCLDVLPALPAESFDALVTDPPFGIGFAYGAGREETADPESYWRWLRPRYEAALRLVKPGGFVAVWQTQRYFRHLWDWFGDGIHVYAACKNFVQMRPTPVNYGYDPVVLLYKAGARLSPGNPPRSVDFYVANTAGVVSDRTRAEKAHPCPRPLDQVRELVRNFVVEGGTVLDPFCGSGTTGVACLGLGRRFVGVEIDPAYAALSRVEPAAPLFAAAPGLFDAPAPGAP